MAPDPKNKPEEEETEVETEEEEKEEEYTDDDDQFSLAFLEQKEEKEEKPAAAATTELEEKPKEPKEPEPEPKPEPEPAPPPSPPTPTPEPAPTPVPPQAPAAAAPVDGAAAQAEMERVALEKMSEYFQLSDEEIERFTTEPEKVLPQMAARVMLRTVQTAVEAIKTLLPQVIAQHSQQQTNAQQAEEKFYTSWPQLKDREDAKPLIVQHANLFRSIYPNASTEEVVKNVGASVMVALGVQHQAQPMAGSGAAEQPDGNGARVVRRESLPPHKPAVGTPPRELAPPKEMNVFAQMALDEE